MDEEPEFSGVKGRIAAWFLTSPLRRVLDFRMGKPDARFLELLQLEGHEVVADFGCGSGYHSLMVAAELDSGRVIGIDLSKEMLDRLRSLAIKRGLADRIEVLEADGLASPLQEGSVDRSVCVAVWHHLGDPAGACREMARVLRSGGRLVAIDLEIPADTKPGRHGHDRPFGQADMARILAESGLEQVGVERVGRWVVGSGVKR